MNVCLINLYSSVKRNLIHIQAISNLIPYLLVFILKKSKKFLRKLFLENSIDWFT